MKIFSPDEANTLLPILESLLRTGIAERRNVEQLNGKFEEEIKRARYQVMLSGGSLLDRSSLIASRSECEKAADRVRDVLAEIDSIGVQVKDLDVGLLDFPCEVDGEIILLCWKLGEPTVAHWHTTEAGFAGRKPIDDRISRNCTKRSES